MTFSEYIIQQRSLNFYFISIYDMNRLGCNMTIEEWFSDLYYDYNILFPRN